MATDPSGNQKKSKGLMIGLIVGGVLLVSCCCTGAGGVGLWFFAFRKTNEILIVGVWREQQVTFDFRKDGKLKRNNFDLVYKFVNANTIEIGPDKQGNNELNGKPYPIIRYRAEITADTLTLTEVSAPPPGEEPERPYILKRQ
ncbi:MAG: hypothetical protein HY289_11265 [Planctomycetes bacterium]|nr:hypothetical protein [Planctomycetota bacterium]